MKKNKILLLILFLCVIHAKSFAQEAITSGGGNATGNNGTVSYTIGQLAYTTNTGTNGSLAMGIQQPYEISIQTGFDELGINLNLSVYPNPTADLLILKVDSNVEKMNYQLYDLSGKLLLSNQLKGNTANIYMAGLDKAIYLLNVMQNNRLVKTFQIIKH